MVKPKSHRTREYLALIPIESALYRLEGVNRRFLEFHHSGNSFWGNSSLMTNLQRKQQRIRSAKYHYTSFTRWRIWKAVCTVCRHGENRWGLTRVKNLGLRNFRESLQLILQTVRMKIFNIEYEELKELKKENPFHNQDNGWWPSSNCCDSCTSGLEWLGIETKGYTVWGHTIPTIFSLS